MRLLRSEKEETKWSKDGVIKEKWTIVRNNFNGYSINLMIRRCNYKGTMFFILFHLFGSVDVEFEQPQWRTI